LPETLSVGDLTSQGLPFYSGKVTYIFNVEKKPENGEKLFLALDSFAGACVRVNPMGSQPRMIAWQPYEAEITDDLERSNEVRLQVVLTRRNTFGPLHQLPLHARAYGPGNFITEGKSFSENYMLMPAGLLSAPEICVKTQTNLYEQRLHGK
jgi:hypothetical protein